MKSNYSEVRIHTSLQNKLPVTPWDDEQLKGKATRLYHETGGQTVMVRLEWIKNDLDRQHFKNVAQAMFGVAKRC